jgi:hypothetical protein
MPRPRKRIPWSEPGWQRSLTDAELLASLTDAHLFHLGDPFVVGRWRQDFVYVTCPYCSQRHWHRSFGHKVADCRPFSGVTSEEEEALGYIVAPRRLLGLLEVIRRDVAAALIPPAAPSDGAPPLPSPAGRALGVSQGL